MPALPAWPLHKVHHAARIDSCTLDEILILSREQLFMMAANNALPVVVHMPEYGATAMLAPRLARSPSAASFHSSLASYVQCKYTINSSIQFTPSTGWHREARCVDLPRP